LKCKAINIKIFNLLKSVLFVRKNAYKLFSAVVIVLKVLT